VPTPAIFDSAMAGLRTSQAGVLTTSQNVAGANVEGYVRRRPDTRISALSPASIELNGTAFAVEGFTRYYNSLLQSQLLTQKSQTSYTATLTEAVATLDSILIDPSASVSSKLGELFNAAGSLSNDSTSVSYQQAFLGAANRASDRIRVLAGELANISKYASEGLANVLNEANSLVPQLAAINGRIKGGFTPGFSYASPDLLDERDRITQKLQELVGGQTILNEDGTANYYAGGLQLVDRDYANSFANGSGTKPVIATTDVSTLRLRVSAPSWSAPKLVPLVTDGKSQLIDGKAGAYVHLLQTFVPSMEKSVDLLAASLMRGVNSARSQTLSTVSPAGLSAATASPASTPGVPQNTIELSASVTLGTNIFLGQRLFINGIDQGVRVSEVGPAGGTSDAIGSAGTTVKFDQPLPNAIRVGDRVTFSLPALREVAAVFGYQSTSSAGARITDPADVDAIFRRTEGFDVGEWRNFSAGGGSTTFVVSNRPDPSIVGMTIYINGVDTGKKVASINGSTVTASGSIGAPVAGQRVEYFAQEETNSLSSHPSDPLLRTLYLKELYQDNVDLTGLRVEYFHAGSSKWRDAGRVAHTDGPLVIFEERLTEADPTFSSATKFRLIRDNSFDEVLGRVDPATSSYSASTAAALNDRKLDATLFQSVATSSANQFQNLDAGAARQIEGLRNRVAVSVSIVVTAAANTIATWQSSNEANGTLEKSLMDQKEAISGVNLDEEAANLVKYQQLYNASSKLLQAGRQMFDTLLSMLTVN
jgi:flagellar hook-associated protein 1 FlgK